MHTDPEIEKRCPYCHPERKKAETPTLITAQSTYVEYQPESGMAERWRQAGLREYAMGQTAATARQHQAMDAQRRQYEAYQRQVRNIALMKYPESEGNA